MAQNAPFALEVVQNVHKSPLIFVVFTITKSLLKPNVINAETNFLITTWNDICYEWNAS